MQLGYGFMEARVLLTAVELGLFERLSAGARSASDLAAALGTEPLGTEILLNALAAMGMLTREQGAFALREPMAELLLPDSGQSLHHVVRHLSHLWELWSDLSQRVSTGHRTPAHVSAESRSALALSMRRMARESARRLAELVARSDVHRMVDLGGGAGAFCLAMAQRLPALHAVLVDRDDEALAFALREVRAAGLEARVEIRRADVLADDFGADYDLALLSSVVSTCSEAQNRHLLERVKHALRPGGRVFIRDYMLDAAMTSPPSAALFSVCMLVATSHGRVYGRAEVTRWLDEAGFEGVHWIPMDDMRVMIGRKPTRD